MKIPIEDFFEDVLGKAMRGKGLNAAAVAEIAGVSKAQVVALTKGDFDETSARAVASVLDLHADSLVSMAMKEWYPDDVDIEGLAVFNTPWGDMRVNAFLVWDPATKKAAVFDTGADASPVIAKVREIGLEVESIFITHTHRDHIADLARLVMETGDPPVYVNSVEIFDGAQALDDGSEAMIGELRLKTFLTSGHALGGNTYFIEGLGRPVAVVGDALFCLSMGGGMVSFDEALKNNREKIMTLPDETIVCPGHGPMTTVGEEKAQNPFFPEWK